jgi:hypothetical protein
MHRKHELQKLLVKTYKDAWCNLNLQAIQNIHGESLLNHEPESKILANLLSSIYSMNYAITTVDDKKNNVSWKKGNITTK